jgi:hypothetical protein
MDVSAKRSAAEFLRERNRPQRRPRDDLRKTSTSVVVAAGDCVRLRSLRFAPTHIHRPYSRPERAVAISPKLKPTIKTAFTAIQLFNNRFAW